MTVKELYDSVAHLGFETTLENDDRFYFAANRAIIQVNRIRPATSIYKLNHFPLKNLLTDNTFEPVCKDEEALVFACDGAKGYYFECNGNGIANIEKSTDLGETWDIIGSVELVSADGRFIAYKGIILDGGEPYSGLVRIRFSGEYIYYVQNVALYGSLIGAGAENVPAYGKYVPYDLASLASDFASFACPPIVDAQRSKSFVLDIDYFIDGASKILIPASVTGVYDIYYNRKIKPINSTDARETTVIDLDEELCAILPNLIASYVWVEDEPEKAEYYLSLYREQVAEIAMRNKNFSPAVYRNKNGW